MQKTSFSLDIAGKTITLTVGQLAQQASASVLAQMENTTVLATVVCGNVREDLGYFPLMVEYVERLYAGGRIKGSRWVKREGRPSDDAVLTARLIDRSIRPLFPKEFTNEVQVVVTVLSVDGENEPDVLSIIAVSAALAISKIPWKGPIGAVRIGLVSDKEFLINPRTTEIVLSELDIIASQTKEKTIMIEAGASQVSENDVLTSLQKAHEITSKIIAFIEGIQKEIGQKKERVEKNTLLSELSSSIEKTYKEEIASFGKMRAIKEAGSTEGQDLVDRIFEEEKVKDPQSVVDKKLVAKAVEQVLYKGIRENVVKNGIRVDGRGIDEVRQIAIEVGILPRTHGSAIFQRGNTQSLTVVTLGSPRLEQLIESAEGEESKRYIHHYSMPPYSVGEVGRIGVPSRREIGHGALAERAILPVIPSKEKFPYTIRVVSEILSSNGSTSMAATCGSSLALMDAGVPIEKAVAGVAMGMMTGSLGDKEYVLLTDILGLEDFSGDMDFKIAGTKDGVTAIQLDVKIDGLTITQINETFERAKKARLFILEKMLSIIPGVRPSLSEFAPKIEQIRVPMDKIGEVIGPGGKVIRNIIATSGAEVDVDDDGIVTVSASSEEMVKKALEMIEGLTVELKVGQEFFGEVKRILPFGAFVEVLPGKEGMVHVSKMSSGFVKSPNDVVTIGQKVKVKVIEIDEQGRTNLSMVLEGSQALQKEQVVRPQNDHPLSRQFRRERAQIKNTSDSRNQQRGYRKTHY